MTIIAWVWNNLIWISLIIAVPVIGWRIWQYKKYGTIDVPKKSKKSKKSKYKKKEIK